MASDPFDELLDLEDNFYREGYDVGLADGEHAGLVEGKIFGIEKGYEKALELGKLHGRALVWKSRQDNVSTDDLDSNSKLAINKSADLEAPILNQVENSKIPPNNRLRKHVENLLATSGDHSIVTDNSDEAVSEFDDRLSRAQAKVKVIAAIVGEPLASDANSYASSGIEESVGLNARH